jgi:hypothetical protein
MIDPWKALRGLKQFSCYQPPDRSVPDPEKLDVERRLRDLYRYLAYAEAFQDTPAPQFDHDWERELTRTRRG